MAQYPLFVNAAYQSQSPIADDERLINWYVENIESPGGKVKAALYPTPGVDEFVTVAQVGGRAMFAQAGRCFAVIGTGFYEIFSTGTATLRGTVALDTNPAQIVSNGDGGQELFITSGRKGYTYDLVGNTLTQTVGAGGSNLTSAYADFAGSLYGYFVSLDVSDSRFYISDLLDGTTWDALQFAERTIGPDPWVSMYTNSFGQIWLFGGQTTEVWYNNGASPFPFAPDTSGLMAFGCAAPYSVREANDMMVWLATTSNGGYQVMAAKGYNPQRISTYALEYAIANYDTIDDAYGETYNDLGHVFYLLTFPSENVTWCYDFRTGLWHERGTWIPNNNAYDAWRPQWHCFAFNKHLMADRDTGTIYHMDVSYSTDVDGRYIRRLRRAPALFTEHKKVKVPKIEVFLESGLGLTAGPAGSPVQGQDPELMIRASNDGGKTWGNERMASAGMKGDYSKRLIFWRFGQARDRVFEIVVSDPIPWRILDSYAVVSVADEPS